MRGRDETRNEISGGIFFSAVVQGRDITVVLPPEVRPSLYGLRDGSRVFTGREEDLRQLMGLLDPAAKSDAVTQVSVVCGLAGVGKTELALQAAHAALRRGWFPAGALFVDMFGYDSQRKVAVETALEGLLRAVGIPGEHIPAETQDRSRMFSSVIAAYAKEGRPVLVVIDNVSWAAQARPLLPAGATAVVTSRHILASLDARLLDLDVLTPQAGAEFLAGQLKVSRGTDIRADEQPDQALVIAQLCGGLPLALRVVAALLAAHPGRALSSMAAELHDARTRLDELSYAEVDGDIGVRSAFDLSYRQLRPEQARLFYLLTLNPGPEISTRAASAMAASDERNVRRNLEELARAHLIEVGSSEKRWRMHDLIRLYAAEHPGSGSDERHERHAGDPSDARDAPGREQAQDRLIAYYLETTGAADAHLRALPGITVPAAFPGRESALAWLDAEHLNLMAVIAVTASTGRDEAAMQLADRLAWYLSWRRRFDDQQVTAIIGRDAAQRLGDRHGEGKAVGNLARVLQEVRRFDEAIDAHREAAAIFREIGDRRREAMAACNLGFTLLRTRQFDEAIAAERGVAAIFREIGDRPGEAVAMSGLGSALTKVRRFDEAIVAHQEGAAIRREIGDRYEEGKAVGDLGTAF